MDLLYCIGVEEYHIQVYWNTVNDRSSVFQNIVLEVGKKHGINIARYHEYSMGLDALTDKLYVQIDLFIREYSGVPYNPKLRRTITHAFGEISNSIEEFKMTDLSQEHDLLVELFTVVLDRLQDMVNIYLTDFSYQSKYRERMKDKEQYIEVTNPIYLSVEFEDELLQTIAISSLLDCLTKTQRTRFEKHILLRYTFQEIADTEGVSWQSVQESIVAAQKKLAQFLLSASHRKNIG